MKKRVNSDSFFEKCGIVAAMEQEKPIDRRVCFRMIGTSERFYTKRKDDYGQSQKTRKKSR